ncbi:MAG: beta-ketoacyl synthase N-terminal-like domain-containing protein [Spirochaetaceae bacterium]|nr:beta-ketoacyl synthase N-terminal-like domain-containing protein [Spirochaetaceae bacterium]
MSAASARSGSFSGPGRFASPYEGLIRDDREKLFDRSLFGMSHNEMMTADPHVRMLLTCTWETCERAFARYRQFIASRGIRT